MSTPASSAAICQTHPTPETQPKNNSEYRQVPWILLQTLSSTTALVMSAIWAHRNHGGPLTNAEIARRSGIRGGPDAVRYHLAKLEGAGHIRRHGNHKNRAFEILMPTEPPHHLGLTIPPDILQSNLSSTQKLLASAIRTFQRAGAGWICGRLGIEMNTYHRNISLLKPLKKCKCNPLKNASQPLKKCKPRYRGGIDEGEDHVCLKANGGAAAQKDFSSLPCQEEYMFPGMTMTNIVNIRQKDMRRADTKPARLSRIDIDSLEETTSAITELKHEVLQHRYIRRPATKKTINKALEVIEALAKPGGLTNVVSEPQQRHIVQTMTRSGLLTEGQVVEALSRQFDDPFERIELYRRLNDNQATAPGSPRRSLADMVYDTRANPGWSDFVKVIVNMGGGQQELPQVGVVQRAYPEDNKIFVAAAVKALKEYFDTCPKPPGFRNGKSAFGLWLNEFMDYAGGEGRQSGERGSYALRPGTRTFGAWVSEWWQRCRQRTIDKAWGKRYEEQAEFERQLEEVEFWIGERGYQAAIEQFGKELVDKVGLK